MTLDLKKSNAESIVSGKIALTISTNLTNSSSPTMPLAHVNLNTSTSGHSPIQRRVTQPILSLNLDEEFQKHSNLTIARSLERPNSANGGTAGSHGGLMSSLEDQFGPLPPGYLIHLL